MERMIKKRIWRMIFAFAISMLMIAGLIPTSAAMVYAEYDYSGYIPAWDDSEEELADKQVFFNGRPWNIIEDNSVSATEGSVTLLAADTSFGSSPIGPSGTTDYNTSTVKSALDALTAPGGSFADVAEAIVTTEYGKLYLLSREEAAALPTDLREIKITERPYVWWLRTPAFEDTFFFVYGYIEGAGYSGQIGFEGGPTIARLVRPALKLDLSLVVFSAETKTFSLKSEQGANAKIRAFVDRMYRVALGRTPSGDEANDWVNGLKNKNKKGADIAVGFYTSPELLNKKLSNEEYVELAYMGIMGRTSDEVGKKNWIENLEAGVTYNAIVKGFVESTEFKNLCAEYDIEPGEVTVTEPRDLNVGVTKFVSRLYTQALGRGFDGAGLNDWCSRINADPSKQNIMNVATVGFFHSSEFMGKDLDNEEFVKVLYHTFLGRGYDEAGLESWVAQLESGLKTRDQVMEGFAYSTEFSNIMASYGL